MKYFKPERSNLSTFLLENKHSINSINENEKNYEIGRKTSSWEELFTHKNKYQNENLLTNEQTKFELETVYKKCIKNYKNKLNLKFFINLFDLNMIKYSTIIFKLCQHCSFI